MFSCENSETHILQPFSHAATKRCAHKGSEEEKCYPALKGAHQLIAQRLHGCYISSQMTVHSKICTNNADFTYICAIFHNTNCSFQFPSVWEHHFLFPLSNIALLSHIIHKVCARMWISSDLVPNCTSALRGSVAWTHFLCDSHPLCSQDSSVCLWNFSFLIFVQQVMTQVGTSPRAVISTQSLVRFPS